MKVYFWPDDIDAVHANFIAKGLKPSEIAKSDYGSREFVIEGPEGYPLRFQKFER
jgi:hypothetical protein